MKSRIFAVLILIAAHSAPVRAESKPSIFPFAPKDLLHALPTAPAEWKVIRSDAETTLSEWPQTTATRVYQVSSPATATEKTAEVVEVEIALIDTAGYAPALASFANFSPIKTEGFEKKLIGALPAIVSGKEDERQVTQVLVSGRYLIEITLTNPRRSQRAEDWLRLFRFTALPANSPAPTNTLREFRVSYFDELNPANNRSHLVSSGESPRLEESSSPN